MKKFCLFLSLCILFTCCATPIQAQAQELPVVNIRYAANAVLSQSIPVEAVITLDHFGQEISFDALLRLNDESMDEAEKSLPQKSLYISNDTSRFILYNDGIDALYTKVTSAVCCSLIAQGPLSLPVCAQEPVEVYLNDEYWGLYTRRESIADAIARFEGLDSTALLNIANCNYYTINGDASGLKEIFQRIKSLDLSQEENRQILNTLIDTESFLNWMAVQSFFGTPNLLSEVFFYQVEEGPWKCAAGDFSYALFTAKSNAISKLVSEEDKLFYWDDTAMLADKMLKEPGYRDAFLSKLGTLYKALPVTLMQTTVDNEHNRIASALTNHMNRWANEFIQSMSSEFDYPVSNEQEALLFQQYRVHLLRDKTLVQRPWYLYNSVQQEMKLSDEEMMFYFGSSKPELPEVPDDTWQTYKEVKH